MAWGVEGEREYRCPECGSEWRDEAVEWFYDPTLAEVTSERIIPAVAENHKPGCRYERRRG